MLQVQYNASLTLRCCCLQEEAVAEARGPELLQLGDPTVHVQLHAPLSGRQFVLILVFLLAH